MENKSLDNIVENLLYILPIMRKKLLKIDPSDVSQDIHLSSLHVGIMWSLHREMLPISEIANQFLISKPQMTLLIDQLVKAEMVERQPNKHDRRMNDITLTEKGKSVLSECKYKLKNNFKELLMELTEKEQTDLYLSLQKLREIGTKWESALKTASGPSHSQ
jgi:DNA-binding MarR family transcriptional regulator